jgi:hypothetical protein
MHSDISLEIYGRISDARIFNAILEEALENCEDARLAAADAGDGADDEMIAVARYVAGLSEDESILVLARDSTRMDFSDLRGQLRQAGVSYRYMQGGDSDNSPSEVWSFPTGGNSELYHEIAGDSNPVFAFADVERANSRPGGVNSMLEAARRACFLPEDAAIVLDDGLVDRWIADYASAESSEADNEGATAWTR